MRRSERLGYKLQLASPVWCEATNALWAHPRLDAVLPELLFTTHCLMRASVPLMETALARAIHLSPTDPVAAGLTTYFPEHIVEERGHDEWLLDDLTTVGMSRAEVQRRVPPPVVAALTGAQYYWILHYHPVALLGYITVMEGYPPTREHLETAIARAGLPRDGLRTYLHHAALDPHHRDELHDVLDALPLSAEQESLVGLSSLHTVELVTCAFEALIEPLPLAAASAV